MHKHFANQEQTNMYMQSFAKYPCDLYIVLSMKKENRLMSTLEYFFGFNDTSDIHILKLREFETCDIKKLDHLFKKTKWENIERNWKYSFLYCVTISNIDDYYKIDNDIKNMLTKIEFSDFYE